MKTPEEFKAEIDILREEGADGWIIWKYGGPGAGGVDITDYLSVLDLPPVFQMEEVTVHPNTHNRSATITWNTDLPTIGRVEYSTLPLFTVSSRYDPGWDFDYLDIDHANVTIAESWENVTQHAVTLTNLEPNVTYYFRVQSQDIETVTSKVLKFSLMDN